jgi:hypothetical protein
MAQQTDLGEEFDIVVSNQGALHRLRERVSVLGLVDFTGYPALCHSATHIRCFPFTTRLPAEVDPEEFGTTLISLVENSIKHLEETDLTGWHGVTYEVDAKEGDSSFLVELSLFLYQVPGWVK